MTESPHPTDMEFLAAGHLVAALRTLPEGEVRVPEVDGVVTGEVQFLCLDTWFSLWPRAVERPHTLDRDCWCNPEVVT